MAAIISTLQSDNTARRQFLNLNFITSIVLDTLKALAAREFGLREGTQKYLDTFVFQPHQPPLVKR